MRKLIIVEIMAICMALGFIAGEYVTTHRIVDVEKSEYGFEVRFDDGTGHYYEY